jgi:hypothetical protein
MRGIGLKGQISEFVDDQEFWLGKLREPLLEPALAMTFGKLRNDCGGCDELHGMPSQDRFTPQRDRKVRLADASQDSVTMPGVRRSRSGSTIRFILDAARWCRSRSGGGSQARITWSWFSQTARSLWSRPGWRRQWLALPLSPRALGYRSVGSSSCAHDSIRF